MSATTGEVVQLRWRSLSGKVILCALTADYRELAREECDDADLERTTAFLYTKLDIAAVPPPTRGRPRSPANHVKGVFRRHLELVR